MKFTISRDLFADAVSNTAAITRASTLNPVLEHIHISAAEGQVVLSACDGDSFIRQTIAQDIDTAGEALLPAGRLLALVKSFPADKIDVSVDGNQATIKGGKARYKLPVLPNCTLPPTPNSPETFIAEMPCGTLRSWLDSVLPSTDRSSGEGWRRGMLISADGSNLLFGGAYNNVACACEDAVVDPPFAEKREWVPVATKLAALMKLLPSADDIKAHLSAGTNYLHLHFGRVHLYLPLLSVSFPALKGAMRFNDTQRFTCETKPLLAALGRLATVFDDKDINPAVKLVVTDGVLQLQSAFRENSGGESLDVEASGEIEYSTDINLLVTVLRCVPGDQVSLSWESPSLPLMVSGPRAPHFAGLVMPIISK